MRQFFKRLAAGKADTDDSSTDLERLCCDNRSFPIIDILYEFLNDISNQKVHVSLDAWHEQETDDYKINHFLSDSVVWVIIQDAKTQNILANVKFAADEKDFVELKIKNDTEFVNEKELLSTQAIKRLKQELLSITKEIEEGNPHFSMRQGFEIPKFLTDSPRTPAPQTRLTHQEYEVIREIDHKRIGMKISVELWEEPLRKEE